MLKLTLKLLTLIVTLFTVSVVYSQNAYVTVWKTDNPGITSSTSIRIPSFGDYSYSWEEVGNEGGNNSGGNFNGSDELNLTFPSSGIYRIRLIPITGGTTGTPFNRIAFGLSFETQAVNGGDHKKLVDIERWGDVVWSRVDYAYRECSNLQVSASDAPDLSAIGWYDGGTKGMFMYCSTFNSNINHWDVSNITTMYAMFLYATNFNQPLNGWDVGNVGSMSYMFCGAINFNQPLNNWNVSNVWGMKYMFKQAHSFNQSLNDWDVSNVEEMSEMFNNAISFNQPLNNWNVSKVIDMGYMFCGAKRFNQPLNNWDVSKVWRMSYMFSYASDFNQPLNNWNVSKVEDMSIMFADATNFNQPLNDWDVSKVHTMQSMFGNATSFNQPLNEWNVSKVKNMAFMFAHASSFDQPLNEWNMNSVTNMYCIFWGVGLSCSNYSHTLIGWAENPNTPNSLGVNDTGGLKYGPAAQTGRNHLTTSIALGGKGWSILNDALKSNCILLPIGNCNSNIVHSGNISSNLYKTNEEIYSTANVASGTIYQAGKSITMLPGFSVESGKVFEARIAGCN